MSHRLWTIAVLALLPFSVRAADVPKEGTVNFTAFWVMTSLNVMQQGNRAFATYELEGITRTDAGAPMFDSFGQRCMGLAELVDNKLQDILGTCSFTDRDGDHIFMPYSGKGDGKGGDNGTFKLVGGTGKFTGITGTAEYSNPGLPIKADDKALRGVVPHKVSWKLP
jgi:hypothetical protein